MNSAPTRTSSFSAVFYLAMLCSVSNGYADANYTWDIRPFGQLCCWSQQTGPLGKPIHSTGLIEVPRSGADEWNIGVGWQQERDIDSIEISYDGKVSRQFAEETQVQYWFKEWPGEAPVRHTIEDAVDDPWQGKWLTARTDVRIDGRTVNYTFRALSRDENPRAGNLPDAVNYRRTLKIRLLYHKKAARIVSLKVYSPTEEKKVSVRIEFGCDKAAGKSVTGKLEIYNGWIEKVCGWGWDDGDMMDTSRSWSIKGGDKPKGIIVELKAAKPKLPGSNDLTIVTVRSSDGTFSFLADDLEKGPMYIPAYSVFITEAGDLTTFADSNVKKGRTVRDKLKLEGEQTYSRAGKEIPPLQVMLREDGGRLYLPVAADASWQKFAVEWGGGFFMNKRSTKAKGRELLRCNWKKTELHWYIGTGEKPVYDRDDKTSQMSVLSDYLPVAVVRWNHEGLNYYEEAFVTLLEGPLSPYDPERNEQTPAILMIKLDISNPAGDEKTAHLWLKPDSLEKMFLQDNFIMDRMGAGEFIRACVRLPQAGICTAAKVEQEAAHYGLKVQANESVSMYIYVPFVGDLTEQYKTKIAGLDYDTERKRVVSYWRNIVNAYKAFDVPEMKFNDISKSVLPHIRMSTTKDPKSGLFMVPAATFGYGVYANESAFQTIFLDRVGDHETAAHYLETFLRLQGTDPLPGTFTGDQSAVFHGGKVDDEYNYTSGPYNLDHGTVLWALARHYLMSHDFEWLRHAEPGMLKAADWIIQQRNQTKLTSEDGEAVLHYGLLPAGRLEDNDDWGFWFAVNAYAWLGLEQTARAFQYAGLPDGDRLAKEAQAYLDDLRTAVRRTSELAPVVRLRNNTYVPFVPSRVYQRFRYFGPMRSEFYSRYKTNTLLTFRLSATREALYGPMILLTTGIIEPHTVLAEAILDDWEDNITLSSSLGQHIHGVVDDEYWFSRGGMVFQPNLQNPIQAYLLSNEIPAAVRSIYNAMTSCLYGDVTAFTEEYRRWGIGSGPMYKIPDESRFVNRVCDMLVLEVGDELWLAAGTPRYWLEPGRKIEVYNIETVFGGVAYVLRHGSRPCTIEAAIKLPTYNRPEKVVLFVRSPFQKPIKGVQVNGKDWSNWDDTREAVFLPAKGQNLEVTVSY